LHTHENWLIRNAFLRIDTNFDLFFVEIRVNSLQKRSMQSPHPANKEEEEQTDEKRNR